MISIKLPVICTSR